MKYYFEYEVICKDRRGKTSTVKLRADNPPHLIQRFRKKYPSRLIVSFKPCEE